MAKGEGRKGRRDWGALAADVVEGAPEDMLLWEWAQLDVRKAARALGVSEENVRDRITTWSGQLESGTGGVMVQRPVRQKDAPLLAVTKPEEKRRYSGVVRDSMIGVPAVRTAERQAGVKVHSGPTHKRRARANRLSA